MRDVIIKLSSFVVLVGFLFWLGTLACSDDPVGPEPVKDYPFYFFGPEGTPELFVLHPETRQIDSIELPWNAREEVTVSADGKRLYLTDRDRTVAISTDSYEIIAEIQLEGRVAVSPDNQLLAILGEDTRILDAEDYSVIFQDTIGTNRGVFSSDSKRLYCVGGTGVVVIDMGDSLTQVTSVEFPDIVTSVVPSRDESRWFVYRRLPPLWTYAFEVYDVLLDSIIFREVLVPGAGRIAITPNGEYVFYTNPGRSATDPPVPPAFTIFDVSANAIDRVVEDIDFFSDSTWVAHPNCMAVSPDGRWLAILGGSLALRVLYLYDIQEGELVFREDWGGSGHVFTNLSVQNSQ